MSGFTSDWLLRHQMRQTLSAKALKIETPCDGVEREMALHEDILAECARRGWRVVRSDPSRPTTNGAGVCDFIIYAEGGRMFHVECKSSTGKLSVAQQGFITWLAKLGHRVHVVSQFREFLEVIRGT